MQLKNTLILKFSPHTMEQFVDENYFIAYNYLQNGYNYYIIGAKIVSKIGNKKGLTNEMYSHELPTEALQELKYL